LTTAPNLPRECNSNTHNLSFARDTGNAASHVDDGADFQLTLRLRVKCCRARLCFLPQVRWKSPRFFAHGVCAWN
jgi:hypothetical protein